MYLYCQFAAAQRTTPEMVPRIHTLAINRLPLVGGARNHASAVALETQGIRSPPTNASRFIARVCMRGTISGVVLCAACELAGTKYIDAPKPEFYDLETDPLEAKIATTSTASRALSMKAGSFAVWGR